MNYGTDFFANLSTSAGMTSTFRHLLIELTSAAGGRGGLGALTVLTLQSWLLFFGVTCMVIVLLTHVAERLHLFPNMGWGLQNSPGHYLDLISAIVGCISLLAAFALRIAARRRTGR